MPLTRPSLLSRATRPVSVTPATAFRELTPTQTDRQTGETFAVRHNA
jgi:hypothetical protein